MINLCKQKFTVLQQEIMRLLFVKVGNPLNIREIAKSLDVSSPAVAKALIYIENEGFVTLAQDKESKRWSIELKSDNHRVVQLKRTDNLRQIYESGLADFLETTFAGGTVILFGSYSRGEDTINSDIDIAIIGRKEKKIDLKDFNNMLEREIRINFYDSFGKIHKNLRENLFNGIVISGGIRL